MTSKANRLIHETSPYLLQHAHNPVDWYAWGPEALNKAREEDKPILVSIGYAACHWCHVMERESFEQEATAAFMNHHFINIKVDREERPDLDHIYMDAVQTITGSGGWPLNVFLTPDAKPFYGGTYFPPQPVANRSSWMDVLQAVVKAFNEKRPDVEAQAAGLTGHLTQSNDFGISSVEMSPNEAVFTKENARMMYGNIMRNADTREGGFGRAPKFPQTFIIRYLLQHYHYTSEQKALDQARLSLDKMIMGGIYDQLGGGFARYSTDDTWLAPHFEKMLYDNALLVHVLSDAWSITGSDLYRKAIEQTMDFVINEWLSPEYGFFSAFDADSEGEEGKYYVWEKKEIDDILGADATLFNEFYGVEEDGNWEHRNILHATASLDAFAASKSMSVQALERMLTRARQTLLQYRGRRPRPLLDDKMLLGWNALMNTACSKAFAALGHESYREAAVRNMDFIWDRFGGAGKNFFHTWKNGQAKYPAFLDDYANLIEAFIHLQEVTGNLDYLLKARRLTELVIEGFSEEGTGFFFFTHKDQRDVILRKKEVYDGATPSGNAVMAQNLYYLGVIFDLTAWKERAADLCRSLHEVVIKYPTSFGVWATMIQGLAYGVPEIVIAGDGKEGIWREFLSTFIPNRVFQPAVPGTTGFPLLEGKSGTGFPQIYLCKNYACQNPVTEIDALLSLLSDSPKL